jgi:hypothetical protein
MGDLLSLTHCTGRRQEVRVALDRRREACFSGKLHGKMGLEPGIALMEPGEERVLSGKRCPGEFS